MILAFRWFEPIHPSQCWLLHEANAKPASKAPALHEGATFCNQETSENSAALSCSPHDEKSGERSRSICRIGGIGIRIGFKIRTILGSNPRCGTIVEFKRVHPSGRPVIAGYADVAQSVEHTTFNRGVWSSNLHIRTTYVAVAERKSHETNISYWFSSARHNL